MHTSFSVPSARRGSVDSTIAFDADAHADATTTRGRGRAIRFTMKVTIARSASCRVSESETLLMAARAAPIGDVAAVVVRIAPGPVHRHRVQEDGVLGVAPLVEGRVGPG